MSEQPCSRDRVRTPALVALALAAATGMARAQPAPAPGAAMGTVGGRVLAASGQPAADAHVEIVELGRRLEVDAAGGFRFEAVPAGAYIVHAESARWA